MREIGEKFDLQVLRFFMLSAHYRSPLNFSAELMESSKNGLERILNGLDKLRELEGKKTEDSGLTEEEKNWVEEAHGLTAKYEAAMEDDFNTADGLSAVFELVKLSNSTAGESSSREYIGYMKKNIETLCQVLGLVTERKAEVLDEQVEALIVDRQKARKEKNFALADEIRQKLLDMGIILEDTREGVKWKRA